MSSRSDPSIARSPNASARCRTPTWAGPAARREPRALGDRRRHRPAGAPRAPGPRFRLPEPADRLAQREGLVQTAPGATSACARSPSPTAGRRERALLDERSDALARDLLAPLSPAQRAKLVGRWRPSSACSPPGWSRSPPRNRERRRRATASRVLQGARRPLRGRIRLEGEPADRRRQSSSSPGCAGSRSAAARSSSPTATSSACGSPRRRAGSASGGGCCTSSSALARTDVARLETNRALQEAIALYRASGYEEVAPFNDEPYAHHWFEKRL